MWEGPGRESAGCNSRRVMEEVDHILEKDEREWSSAYFLKRLSLLVMFAWGDPRSPFAWTVLAQACPHSLIN